MAAETSTPASTTPDTTSPDSASGSSASGPLPTEAGHVTIGPAGVAEVRAQTRADREEFLTAGLVPVACDGCATTVLVKKNSPEHTSIQWITDAATSCPVLAERVAAGAPAARAGTCGRLRESIAAADRDGAFPYD